MSDDDVPAPAPLVTVTLNPALDLSTSVEVVVPDHKLRCERASREPGGGGVNVARVASRLGVTARAVVVVGGATGEQLVALADAEGLAMTPIQVSGETRQSLSVIERSSGRQYRFVLPGPSVELGVIDAVDAALGVDTAVGCVVFSGSLPPDLDAEALVTLVGSVTGAQVVIDTSGQALLRALDTTAAVVKPSARELAAVAGRQLLTETDVLNAAEEVLAGSSVGALLVSIGAGGAFLLQRGEHPVRLRPPTVRVASAVGAGDSMVGGLASGLCRGEDLLSAAKLGIAAGSAAVMTPGSGLCTASAVAELLPLVTVG